MRSRFYGRNSNESCKFFLRVIRQGNPERTGSLITQLGKETRDLINSILEIVYYMRGSISYHECLAMSPGERDIAVDLINRQFKLMKENQQVVLAL